MRTEMWNADCAICWGTGVAYPTPFGTLICPNGCHPRLESGVKYAGAKHLQILCTDYDRVGWVDVGVRDLMLALWELAIPTNKTRPGWSLKSLESSPIPARAVVVTIGCFAGRGIRLKREPFRHEAETI